MIGRENELGELQTFYLDPAVNIYMLYGRKGMGKTALLREFAQGKQSIFFTAYSTTEKQERALMARAFEYRDIDDLKDEPPKLNEMLDQITSMSEDGTAVFIIDNYTDFAKADDKFPELLHSYMKEKWQTGRVKLVLCGDSYLNMEKCAFGAKAIWKDIPAIKKELRPLGFYDSTRFFENSTDSEKILYYGLSGGIPALLCEISQVLNEDKALADEKAAGSSETTPWKIVKKLFLSVNEGSCSLPESILSDELREKSYYNRLLYALASGICRVNRLSDALGRPKDVVVPYLNSLSALGMVTKENPVTEPTNRRKTRYSIVNTADRFWYGTIVPVIDALYAGEMDPIEESVEITIDAFLESVFINVCREYMIKRSEEHKLPLYIRQIGNWWENIEETGESEDFDIVALGESEGKSAMAFARCYFREEPIGMADLKNLIDLTKKVRDKEVTYYFFFSKNGFEENTRTAAATIKNIMLINLKDMF